MANLMRDPVTATIAQQFGTLEVDTPDQNRKSFLIQNLGPGNIWFTTQQQQASSSVVGSTGGPRGIRILPGASYADHPIWPHCGVVWVMADAAQTVFTFAKWGPA